MPPLKQKEKLNTLISHNTMYSIQYRNPIRKVTGSGHGTAEVARTETAPLHLAKKDVQKGPKSKLTGSGSGTAGDAPIKSAPLQNILAKDYPLRAKKADSAVRVVMKKTHYLVLAKDAQQLPPKTADEPLSFCTHKEKGHQGKHQGNPQARSERRPTGTRAYLPRDSAVRVQSPPPS